MFVLANTKELRALVEDAGFANVQIDDVPVHNDYRDVDEYVRRSNEMGGMFSRAWAAAPEDRARGDDGRAPRRVRALRG